MRDKLLLGSIAGMAGAATMIAANSLLNLIPGINLKLIFGVSEIFVSKALTGTVAGNIIGGIAALTCGALVGVAILYAFEFTGYHYLLIKGTFLGLASWFLLCGILARILRLGMQDTIIDNILMITIHLLFGLITAWVIGRYRKKTPV